MEGESLVGIAGNGVGSIVRDAGKEKRETRECTQPCFVAFDGQK